jgi:hypothetical protein
MQVNRSLLIYHAPVKTARKVQDGRGEVSRTNHFQDQLVGPEDVIEMPGDGSLDTPAATPSLVGLAVKPCFYLALGTAAVPSRQVPIIAVSIDHQPISTDFLADALGIQGEARVVAGGTGVGGEVKVEGVLADEALRKEAVGAVGTGLFSQVLGVARVIGQRVIAIAADAVRVIVAGAAVRGTAFAREGGGVEVEVVWVALVANCEVVAVLAGDLAGLACQPRRSDREGPQRTLPVAVELVVVLRALLQAPRVTAVPPQAPRLRRIPAADLSEQHVAAVIEEAGRPHQDVAVQAEQAVGLPHTQVTPFGARETQSRTLQVGLRQTQAFAPVVLVEEILGAVERVVGLHVVGAIAVDGTEPDSGAARKAGEAVRGAGTGVAALDGLGAV